MHVGRVRGWVTALLIGLPLACGNMSGEELVCEEAVAHLQDCCPGFSCIRGESCADLVQSGVCARAEKAWTTDYPDDQPSSGDVANPQATVCP